MKHITNFPSWSRLYEEFSEKEVTLPKIGGEIDSSQSGHYAKNQGQFDLKSDTNTYSFKYEDFEKLGIAEYFRLIPTTDYNHHGTWTRNGNDITVQAKEIQL